MATASSFSSQATEELLIASTDSDEQHWRTVSFCWRFDRRFFYVLRTEASKPGMTASVFTVMILKKD